MISCRDCTIIQCILLLLSTHVDLNYGSPQYRRCRNPIQYHTETIEVSNITDHNNSGRNNSANGNHTVYHNQGHHNGNRTVSVALQEFYNSQCEVCPTKLPATETTFRMLSNKTRAVLFLTHTATMEKSLIIAAGLLTSGSRVSIMIGGGTSSSTSNSKTTQRHDKHASSHHVPPQDQYFIRQLLFQHIPCDKHVIASILLTFSRFTMDNRHCPVGGGAERTTTTTTTTRSASGGDILLCNVQSAEATIASILPELNLGAPPAILIMDATFVAGLLIAEKQLLPAVLIVENARLYLRHILGAPQKSLSPGTTIHNNYQHHYQQQQQHHMSTWTSVDWTSMFWNPRQWYNDVWDEIQDRFNALDVTSAFMALNRVRNRLQLSRIRHIADLWRAGGNIFVSSDPDIYQYQRSLSSTTRILYDPILPSCITCLNTPSTLPDKVPRILVTVTLDNDDRGRYHSKRILHALDLARTSIRQLAADESCSTRVDNQAPEADCPWESLQEFVVVTPTLPEVLPPDYVIVEETVLLDSFARHHPVAILAICDVSTSWIRTLGPPVLCIDLAWSSREIAYQLLSVFYRSTNPPQQSSALSVTAMSNEGGNIESGLERIVVWIEQIGLMRDRFHTNWKSGRDMSRQIRMRMDYDIRYHNATTKKVTLAKDEYNEVGSIFVVLAWLIFLSAATFFAMKDTVLMQKVRLRRWHHHHHHHRMTHPWMSWVLEEIAWSVPELDRVVVLCTEWFTDQLRQWDEASELAMSSSEPSAGSDERDGGATSEPNNYVRRKRHTIKKRH